MGDQEMVDMHAHTTMISSNEIHESAIDIVPLNDRISELPLEPFEGMEFASIEDVKNYYVSYAKNKGFSFRMGRVTKSRTNGKVIGQEILCSKEGFRSKKKLKKENGSFIVHDQTRVGCKAMLYIKKKEDQWVISKFVKDHNHELFSPRSSQFLRVHRKKTKVQKKLIDVLDDSGIGPSKTLQENCFGASA
jgi:hypothetical protein